jgi:hypothetical protein
MRGGTKTVVEPHRHAGVFIARGKEDALVTRNIVPGEAVYGEKRVSVEDGEAKVEYRVWNPFRSKLAAAILGGVDNIYIAPGTKVLYLGASSGTTVSHVADIVGPVRGAAPPPGPAPPAWLLTGAWSTRRAWCTPSSSRRGPDGTSLPWPRSGLT